MGLHVRMYCQVSLTVSYSNHVSGRRFFSRQRELNRIRERRRGGGGPGCSPAVFFGQSLSKRLQRLEKASLRAFGFFFCSIPYQVIFCGKSAECCGFVIRISPHVKGLLHLLHFPTKSVAGRKSNPLSFFPMFTGNNIMRAARRKRRRERKFGMHYASLVNHPPPFPTATPRDSHGFMQLCCREIKANMSLVVQNQTIGNTCSSAPSEKCTLIHIQ